MQLQESTPAVAIALNVDSDEDVESEDDLPAAVATVNKLQVDVDHWFSLTASDKVLNYFDAFSLPAAVVIKHGEVLKKFEGEFTLLDDVLPYLKSQSPQ